MQLVLNPFGAYLHRQGEMFRIKVGEEIKEISFRAVLYGRGVGQQGTA